MTRAESETLLRSLGLRPTPQRMLILQAILNSPGHISAEHIYEQVREEYPHINISTIYRTLELLKEHHAISVTDLGQGSVLYELLKEKRHHHMVCLSCGKILEFDHRFLEPLETALEKEYRFKAQIDHFAIFGLCADCLLTGSRPIRKVSLWDRDPVGRDGKGEEDD